MAVVCLTITHFHKPGGKYRPNPSIKGHSERGNPLATLNPFLGLRTHPRGNFSISEVVRGVGFGKKQMLAS